MMNRMRNWWVLDPVDWRAGMLALMLKVATILGVIVCIPSVYLAVKRDLYGIVFIDVTAISVVFALNFLTGLSFRVRAVAFGLVCYFLGTGLLYLVGSVSQIYLMGSSVLITLLLGTGAGLATVALTTVTLLAMGLTGNVARDATVPLAMNQSAGWWLITLNFTLISHLVVAGVGVALRAIERARENETELLRAQDRDRLLLELQIERMPLAYILTDRDFRCIRWNPAAERIFGFTSDEVLGHKIFDLIVPQSLRAVAEKILEQIRSGRMDVTGEFVNATKSGAPITCEWHNTPMFDNEAKFSGVLSLTFDITARKRLESQLLQSQKMEAIGQLAGGVAHDFNNLLTVIFGYSELVMTDRTTSSDTRTSVQAINLAAQRAAGLTGQLLAFSRKTMLQPRVLDINAVVTETGTMLRRMIGEDVALNTTLQSNINLVRVDPGQLTQVLMNLSVNARDAMPRGGTLSIETQNVELSDEYAIIHPDCRPGPHVMLAITDTGTGMAPDVLAHIFEPFYTTKEVGSGTGLGLATVFGIVRQSGGTINVYSEPGIGSTFKLYFPSLSGVKAMQGGSFPLTAQGGAETVLLVEDDDAVRRLAAASLNQFGYAVLAASSGDEALRLAAVHSATIRVMLTDVVMPGMSGPQLVLAMHERFPHIKAVFMSGYTDDAVVRHGLLAADVSFLQKPFTPAGLALKIRQVLDS